MKSIFPTFEQINNGSRSFSYQYYRNVKGQRVLSEKQQQGVLIIDLDIIALRIEVKINRTKTKKKRLSFTYSIFGKQSKEVFPYTEQGWNDCIFAIKNDLQKCRKSIERIMNEGA